LIEGEGREGMEEGGEKDIFLPGTLASAFIFKNEHRKKKIIIA